MYAGLEYERKTVVKIARFSQKNDKIMKQFDLAAAKAGAPVCTRDGSTSRIICFDRVSLYPIVGLLRNSNNEEYAETFTIDGCRFLTSECDGDLMMRDDDYAEKLARGEYTPSVKENLTVENPTCKESLPVDWKYWRRVYAGQVMPILVDVVVREGRHVVKSGIGIADAVVEDSLKYADALLEELEKTEKKL